MQNWSSLHLICRSFSSFHKKSINLKKNANVQKPSEFQSSKTEKVKQTWPTHVRSKSQIQNSSNLKVDALGTIPISESSFKKSVASHSESFTKPESRASTTKPLNYTKVPNEDTKSTETRQISKAESIKSDVPELVALECKCPSLQEKFRHFLLGYSSAPSHFWQLPETLQPRQIRILTGRARQTVFQPLPQLISKVVSWSRQFPMGDYLNQIMRDIQNYRVTIVTSTTGSGKSTVLPSALLASGARVVVAQPRRIACQTLCQRVTDVLNLHNAQLVGFAMRHECKRVLLTGPCLVYATTGTILSQLVNDPFLDQYSHIILDEIHENTVENELMLAIAVGLLHARPALRLVLMSATFDEARLRSYLEKAGLTVAPNMNLTPSRIHPIRAWCLDDIVQFPGFWRNTFTNSTTLRLQREIESTITGVDPISLSAIPYDLMIWLIQKIAKEESRGSILVFVPGWTEIRHLCNQLQALPKEAFHGRALDLHALHATQEESLGGFAERRPEQLFGVAPGNVLKVVVATNVAESSITVPDIVAVIDLGQRRRKVLDYHHDSLHLPIEWASIQSCRQRMGRCGRTCPGRYFLLLGRKRLFSDMNLWPKPSEKGHSADKFFPLQASETETEEATSLAIYNPSTIHDMNLDLMLLRIKIFPIVAHAATMLSTCSVQPLPIQLYRGLCRLEAMGTLHCSSQLQPQRLDGSAGGVALPGGQPSPLPSLERVVVMDKKKISLKPPEMQEKKDMKDLSWLPEEHLTMLGLLAAKLSLPVGHVRMVLMGVMLGCLDQVLTLLALLTLEDGDLIQASEESFMNRSSQVEAALSELCPQLQSDTLSLMLVYEKMRDLFQSQKMTQLSAFQEKYCVLQKRLLFIERARLQLHAALGRLSIVTPSTEVERIISCHELTGVPSHALKHPLFMLMGNSFENRNRNNLPLLKALLCMGLSCDRMATLAPYSSCLETRSTSKVRMRHPSAIRWEMQNKMKESENKETMNAVVDKVAVFRDLIKTSDKTVWLVDHTTLVNVEVALLMAARVVGLPVPVHADFSVLESCVEDTMITVWLDGWIPCQISTSFARMVASLRQCREAALHRFCGRILLRAEQIYAHQSSGKWEEQYSVQSVMLQASDVVTLDDPFMDKFIQHLLQIQA